MDVEIDDSLYSRQRYVLGDNAMQRMARSNVLLCGAGGLGIEIAKNIVLAGVKSLTIQDANVSSTFDLGTQFFLTADDVKSSRNRANGCMPRLAELNPYVSVRPTTDALSDQSSLEYLREFQCVILTESTLDVQLQVDQFCRQQQPPIKFISADVIGVCACVFCDFGDTFEVVDTTGEEPKEFFISNITKDNPGVVTTMENHLHNLETGDMVTFCEVKGMTALNGITTPVKVISPYTFSICDTTSMQFEPYQNGGRVTQVKTSRTLNFQSLEQQLSTPTLMTPDLSKPQAPSTIHFGFWALQAFRKKYGRLPNIRCAKDADMLITMTREQQELTGNATEQLDVNLLRALSFTARGCLAPLCAAVGGMVAQEALKSLTGKFTPLTQWLHIDASEVVTSLNNKDEADFQPRGDRYDALRICVGDKLCKKLADLQLFMVGCGAIGCEMLKNYALLGLGSTQNGKITITDNDLIEKSNLNRQFLFRPHHIRQPKSTTAAASTLVINRDLNIEAQQHKVCPDSENTIYTDAFFESQSVIVNALDNLEARRYMDSRCVTNQKPLLESGTMGAKGHVQVIVPHLTESYTSQRDPADEDIPYCTLKSFPAQIEHCIQWARDKFESSFTQKPSLHNRFWTTNGSPAEVVQKLSSNQPLEGAIRVMKLVLSRPKCWADCIRLARLKFEKYFNHKARHLLNHFPLDTKLSDGSSFWQSPKRPPTPVEFDVHNPLHLSFIVSCAHLYASSTTIHVTPQDLHEGNINSILTATVVPEYRTTKKRIETDESIKKEDIQAEDDGDLDKVAATINTLLQADAQGTVFRQMSPLSFEKDDDSNHHIDFITAASNLRAAMYSLESADRLKMKRIAGRIVPAIATTTSAVAGLVTVELIKLQLNLPLDGYRNCFLNLALPVFLLSEPGPAEKTTLSNGRSITLWDRWEVQGNPQMTLEQFLQAFKEKYNIGAAMVMHGVKMVYVPIMPGHRKRLGQTMLKLLKPSPDKTYFDLVISFTVDGQSEEEVGPLVRYMFGK